MRREKPRKTWNAPASAWGDRGACRTAVGAGWTLLPNPGRTTAVTLKEYQARGGYTGLKNALAKKPDEVTAIVKYHIKWLAVSPEKHSLLDTPVKLLSRHTLPGINRNSRCRNCRCSVILG